MTCPVCGQAAPRGANFCFACGASLARVCPECRAGQSPEARFCPECGTVLAPGPGEAPASRAATGPGDDGDSEDPPDIAGDLLDDAALEAAIERTRARESRRRVATVAAVLLIILALLGGAAVWLRGSRPALERSAASHPSAGSGLAGAPDATTSPGVAAPRAPEPSGEPSTSAAAASPEDAPGPGAPARPPAATSSPGPAGAPATPGRTPPGAPAPDVTATSEASSPPAAPAPAGPRGTASSPAPPATARAPETTVPAPSAVETPPSVTRTPGGKPTPPPSLPERVASPVPQVPPGERAAASSGARASRAESTAVAAMPERVRADVRVEIRTERLGQGLTSYTVSLSERDGAPVTGAAVVIRGRRADGMLVEAELDATPEPGVYRAALRSGEVRNPRLRVASAGRIQDVPVTE